LLLVQNRMSNKCIRKSCQTSSPLFYESAIGCEVIAIDYITVRVLLSQ
jgi:hypothetical protein